MTPFVQNIGISFSRSLEYEFGFKIVLFFSNVLMGKTIKPVGDSVADEQCGRVGDEMKLNLTNKCTSDHERPKYGNIKFFTQT